MPRLHLVKRYRFNLYAVTGTVLPPQCETQPVILKLSGRLCNKESFPWKDPSRYWTGVNMGLVPRRKVVTADAYNTGWGAL